MSAIERRKHDIRCDGCDRESVILADSAAAAREKLRHAGWRHYKRRNAVYDKCPKCKPPQGEGWRIVT